MPMCTCDCRAAFRKFIFRRTTTIGAFEFDNISVSETVPSAGSGETFLNPPAVISQRIPVEVPVDPRATQVRLPTLKLADSTDATVCYRQVADAAGTPLAATPTLSITAPSATQTATVGEYLTVFGPLNQVQSDTGSIVVSRLDSSRLVGNEQFYVEVASLPSSATPSQVLCDAATTRGVILVRPLDLTETRHIPIAIN